MSQAKQGWLPRTLSNLFGQHDEVDKQIKRLQNQGSHIVRLAHMASTVMIILVSIATLITVGQHTFQEVAASVQSGHPNIILSVALVTLFVLVVCMDIAAVYHSSTLRVMWSRGLRGVALVRSAFVITFVMLLEGLTYWQMILQYERPASTIMYIIGLARAFGGPIIAIDLSLAMVLSVTKADILGVAAVQAGKVAISKLSILTSDDTTPLATTWAAFDAASGPSKVDGQVNKLIQVVSIDGMPPVRSVTVESSRDIQLTAQHTPPRHDDDPPVGPTAPAKPPTTVRARTVAPVVPTIPMGDIPEDVLNRVQLLLADTPRKGSGVIAKQLGIPIAQVSRAVAQLRSQPQLARL